MYLLDVKTLSDSICKKTVYLPLPNPSPMYCYPSLLVRV